MFAKVCVVVIVRSDSSSSRWVAKAASIASNALDSDGAKKLGLLVERHLESGGAVLAASHQRLGGEWRKIELHQGNMA